MSQGTFSDTLNRLAPFFINIFWGSRNRIFSPGGGVVGGMGSKVTKF